MLLYSEAVNRLYQQYVVGMPRELPRLRSDEEHPPILMYHTMVGGLSGTESYFARRTDGVVSHFGLGGPADGADDGKLLQWVSLDQQSGATWDANPFCWSVEMSDGGDPNQPLSAAQLNKAVELTVWWAYRYGISTVRLARYATDYGTVGWHRMFDAWNKSNHACPGAVRERQIRDIIIPRANQLLSQTDDSGDDTMADPEVLTELRKLNTTLSNLYLLGFAARTKDNTPDPGHENVSIHGVNAKLSEVNERLADITELLTHVLTPPPIDPPAPS